MSLTFAAFSALGVIAFRDNDPYHFGRIDMAMWTYFEMATLDVSTHVVFIIEK